MAALAPLPPLPAQFKSIQHHLRTAQEHDKRDPVVAYYCRLYAMQTGMKIDSKTPECRKFLSKLMDQLEALKKQLGDNEAVTQEIVGCAHLENYALKMFLYADNEDRAGRFHKNMIKSFYTASLLIDVITVFGELTDENITMLKKMKMLVPPLCQLSHLSHHHLQHMTQATWHQAATVGYRFLQVHMLQLIRPQKCHTAQV
ncbi:vacuolar protein sorting-associated protein VTA1 homolog isoform X2 [Peromyscus maniculatus bairdii]|uniref:vacuolar protein sorting-associated protein VTA1 homolog isoform X2 n=1 Tax=Peromyscus maniculatus bairdii TaxID=230844 RepID=UPI003FD0FEEB